MVLAVNEALANAAEFAYSTVDQPGAMHLRADYDGGTAVLTVTVTDEGAWRIADPEKNEPVPRPGDPVDARTGRPGHHRLVGGGHAGAARMEPCRRANADASAQRFGSRTT